MEDQVIAESVDGRDRGEAAVRQVEAGTEGVAEGFDGNVEQDCEQLAAFAEDAAQHPRDG